MGKKKEIIKEYKKRHVKKVSGVLSKIVDVFLSIFLILGILVLITNTVNNYVFSNLDELIETTYEIVKDDLITDINREEAYTELTSFINFFDVNCDNVDEKISFYSDEELIKIFVLIKESCSQSEINFDMAVDKYVNSNIEASKLEFEETMTVLLKDFQILDENLEKVFPNSPNLVNFLSFVFKIFNINAVYFFLIAIFFFLFHFVITNDWLSTLFYLGNKVVAMSIFLILPFLILATNIVGFGVFAFGSNLDLDFSVLVGLLNVINDFMMKSTVLFLILGILFLILGFFLKRYSFKKMVYVLANEIRTEQKEDKESNNDYLN